MNRPSGLLRIPAIVVAVLVVALALPGGPAAPTAMPEHSSTSTPPSASNPEGVAVGKTGDV